MLKERENHNVGRFAEKRRWRMIFRAMSYVAIIGLIAMIWLYAIAEKGKQEAEKQLRTAEENIRIAEEKTSKALQSDSIAQVEKQKTEAALEEARQRIAQLEAEKAERNRIEVEKYIASARRMMRVGDRDMAHQILLEAQKLDKTNAEIIALLKEIE